MSGPVSTANSVCSTGTPVLNIGSQGDGPATLGLVMIRLPSEDRFFVFRGQTASCDAQATLTRESRPDKGKGEFLLKLGSRAASPGLSANKRTRYGHMCRED